jgi:hypothetical protein
VAPPGRGDDGTGLTLHALGITLITDPVWTRRDQTVATARPKTGLRITPTPPQAAVQGGGKKVKHTMTFAKFTSSPAKIKEYLKWLEQGATLTKAAAKVGVSRFMVREYEKANPVFAREAEEARMRGFDGMTKDVEDALYRQARAGNVIAMLTWLYNRKPHMWRDMRSLTLKSVDDVLKLLPPGLVKALSPYLGGDVRTK